MGIGSFHFCPVHIWDQRKHFILDKQMFGSELRTIWRLGKTNQDPLKKVFSNQETKQTNKNKPNWMPQLQVSIWNNRPINSFRQVIWRKWVLFIANFKHRKVFLCVCFFLNWFKLKTNTHCISLLVIILFKYNSSALDWIFKKDCFSTKISSLMVPQFSWEEVVVVVCLFFIQYSCTYF